MEYKSKKKLVKIEGAVAGRKIINSEKDSVNLKSPIVTKIILDDGCVYRIYKNGLCEKISNYNEK